MGAKLGPVGSWLGFWLTVSWTTVWALGAVGSGAGRAGVEAGAVTVQEHTLLTGAEALVLPGLAAVLSPTHEQHER